MGKDISAAGGFTVGLHIEGPEGGPTSERAQIYKEVPDPEVQEGIVTALFQHIASKGPATPAPTTRLMGGVHHYFADSLKNDSVARPLNCTDAKHPDHNGFVRLIFDVLNQSQALALGEDGDLDKDFGEFSRINS